MNITTLGTVTITETGITYSGWGNLNRDQEFIIRDWAMERLRQYKAPTDEIKKVNNAVFPGYTPS